jgi:hypothetical protein
MHWMNYWRNVVQRYQVAVEGWPDNIPFVNLSKVSSALPDLEMLLRKWKSGGIYWKELDDDEYQELRVDHDEKIESGKIIESRRRTRSDKGKKRARSFDNSKSGCRKKAYRSVTTIETDDDDAPDNTMSTVPFTSTVPSTSTIPSADTSSTNDPCGSTPPTNGASMSPPTVAGASLEPTTLDPFDFDAALAILDRDYGPAPNYIFTPATTFSFTF